MIALYQGTLVNFRKNLAANLETVCSLEKGCLDREARALTDQNVPRELAETVAILPYLKDVMAILKITEGLRADFIDVGNFYIKLTNYLCLDWIETSLEELEISDPWEEEAAEVNAWPSLRAWIRLFSFSRLAPANWTSSGENPTFRRHFSA